MNFKEHPKYVLTYNKRNPGAPFTIKEYAEAKISGRKALVSTPHSSYVGELEALHALSSLDGDDVVIACSVKTIDNTFTV